MRRGREEVAEEAVGLLTNMMLLMHEQEARGRRLGEVRLTQLRHFLRHLPEYANLPTQGKLRD